MINQKINQMNDKVENAEKKRNLTSLTRGEMNSLKFKDHQDNILSINNSKWKRN